MFANFIGYWVIGLPLGAFLCFNLKLGAVGMWAGLCLALVLIGSALLLVWHVVVKDLLVSRTAATGLNLSASE
jgi:MATE family multidrug resistance protein